MSKRHKGEFPRLQFYSHNKRGNKLRDRSENSLILSLSASAISFSPASVMAEIKMTLLSSSLLFSLTESTVNLFRSQQKEEKR